MSEIFFKKSYFLFHSRRSPKGLPFPSRRAYEAYETKVRRASDMERHERLWNRNFILICAGQLLMVLAFYAAMSTFTMFLEERLSLSGGLLGALASCSIVSAIFARPLAGYWLDTFGRRAVYIPAFFAFGALFFFYPLLTGIAAVACIRLLHGVAWGTAIGAAGTTAVDLIPPSRRGEGIGWYGLSMVLAMAVGPGLGLFVEQTWNFDVLFLSCGALILLGWITVLQLRFPRIELKRKPFSPRETIEKNAGPPAVTIFFVTLSYGCLMNYAALYAKNELHTSPTLFFTFFAVGTAASRLFGGKTYDSRGPKGVLRISFILLTAGLVLLAATKDPFLFFLAALLQGVGDGLCFPVLLAMINDMVPPHRRGAANGTLMTMVEAGIFCGVLITGGLYEPLGWPFVFALMAVFMVIAALIFHFWTFPHYVKVRAALRERTE